MQSKTSTSLIHAIDKSKVPTHVAIIMDGNGRWAKERGEDRTFGHIKGRDAVRRVLQAANKIGVKVLTLYTFSEENWNRPIEEVNALMALLVDSLLKELEELMENDIKLVAIGETELLPELARKTLYEALEKTKNNKGCQLVLALNYSGRTEIVNALNKLHNEYGDKSAHWTDEDIQSALYAPHIPDPDLLIRPGGEQRISNFLLWQLAYTELYFTSTYWPDYGEEEFFEAILDYQRRQRRYGMTGEQIREDEDKEK